MTIPLTFMLTAFVAVIAHGFYLRRAKRRRREVIRQKKVDLLPTATALVQVETTRLGLNLILIITGVGVVMGLRSTAYLLALLPLISIFSSYQALRRL